MRMSLFKLITILSCLFGILFGFLTLLPHIGGFTFFILMCFPAIVIMTYLISTKLMSIDNIAESLTIGGIIGFISYIAFSIVFLPFTILMIKVYHYSTNYGVSVFAQQANVFIITTISIFMAIISATINSCMGFAIYYVTELFNNLNNK